MGGRTAICLVDLSNHTSQINGGDPFSLTYGAEAVNKVIVNRLKKKLDDVKEK